MSGASQSAGSARVLTIWIQHVMLCNHYQPTSDTPSKRWGQIVSLDCILVVYYNIILSFIVSEIS